MSRVLEGLALAILLLTARSAAASNGMPLNCHAHPDRCQPDLEYFGGEVISNVKIYAVFWDGTVDKQVLYGMPEFYKAVVDSEYLDWLTEYSTTLAATAGSHAGQQATGRIIGRGTFAGSITLPSLSTAYPRCYQAPTPVCVTDAQIASELKWQIAQSRVPAPDPYTLYMIHLPSTVVIADPVLGRSCSTYCGYHSTTTSGTGNLYYAVIPEFNTPECPCHWGPRLQGISYAASHEIAEAVTDAEDGLASGTDFPLAWLDAGDPTLGEVGDMCVGTLGTLRFDGALDCPDGTDGCYRLQPIFSRTAWAAGHGAPDTPACVTSRHDEGGDYSLALAPNTVQVPAGASSPGIPVVTSVTARSDPPRRIPLILSVPETPAGVHATLDPTSIDAGETALLTVSIDPGAAPIKDAVLVVQAHGRRNHSAALLLQATAAEAAPPALSIVTPAAGTVVKGDVPVQVTATAGSSPIGSITFLADTTAFSAGTEESAVWSSRSLPDGNHTLTATAVDAKGAAASASVQVTVANEPKKLRTYLPPASVAASTASPQRAGCSSGGSDGAAGIFLVAAALLLSQTSASTAPTLARAADLADEQRQLS